MTPFETTKQTIEKHFIIGIVIFGFILLTLFAFLLLWIEQHHEMERATLQNL